MDANRRILIVDDNSANLDLLEEILFDKYTLRSATNGLQALQVAADFRPDIVLLDIMMPGMNGYEVCRKLKADAGLFGAKVILVSAKALTSERLMGYEAGADDYIVKPFDEQELLAKLRVYLQLKRVEEVDKVKSEVITLLNHETRTPLNAIIGPLQLMTGDVKPSEVDQEELLSMALRSAERLSELLEKALLYGALRAGSRGVTLEVCELGKLVRDALGCVAGRLAEKKIVFAANVVTGVEASIDGGLIRRAVASILDNAVRHTPVGGTVNLDVGTSNGMAYIKISNSGAGIDPKVLPHLFEAFQTPDLKHHSEGQRLSLAIVRQIALEHGGSIDVESEPGAGATFTLRLPCGVAGLQPEAPERHCTAK